MACHHAPWALAKWIHGCVFDVGLFTQSCVKTDTQKTFVAIEFRQWLGGEEAIQTYTSNLAKEGGQLVADILGTEVMEAKESKLTASMVCL